MSDVIRELGVLVNRAQREKTDAFVEANREEIVSAAWGMSETLCRWRSLCAAHPCDKYGRWTEQPTPESEIRVFHAANGPKIVAESDRLAADLDSDMRKGFYAALHIIAQQTINNNKEGA